MRSRSRLVARSPGVPAEWQCSLLFGCRVLVRAVSALCSPAAGRYLTIPELAASVCCAVRGVALSKIDARNQLEHRLFNVISVQCHKHGHKS